MQGKHLFEYAVIRVVPRVEREEFLNVGVIIYCAKQKFLHVLFTLDDARLCAFATQIDCAELRGHFLSMERICLGDKQGGPIADLDMASRFRWLTATRSTVVQPSKVHPGFVQMPRKLWGSCSQTWCCPQNRNLASVSNRSLRITSVSD